MTGASKPKQIKQIGVTEVYRSQAEKPLVEYVYSPQPDPIYINYNQTFLSTSSELTSRV